jgi:hypothetical protein
MIQRLPDPECKLGYTDAQLHTILTSRYEEFWLWMRGQTFSSCDGRAYNHDKKEYEDTGCGPHGFVVYSWDLLRFLEGKPVVD